MPTPRDFAQISIVGDSLHEIDKSIEIQLERRIEMSTDIVRELGILDGIAFAHGIVLRLVP